MPVTYRSCLRLRARAAPWPRLPAGEHAGARRLGAGLRPGPDRGGQPGRAGIGGYPVGLVRTAAGVYARHDECAHQSVPLTEGEVADGAIEYRLHGSRSGLVTGRALSPPATRPVAVFAVRAGAGDTYVRLTAGPPDREASDGGGNHGRQSSRLTRLAGLVRRHRAGPRRASGAPPPGSRPQRTSQR